MKTLIPKLKVALFCLFSTAMIGCGTSIPFIKQSAAEKKEVVSTIPEHTGSPDIGAYGLYSYEVYQHSVSLRAISPIAQILQAEVFDLNKDGTLDSVWALDRDEWKFASTLNSRFRLSLPNTAGESIVRDYIGLANYVKKKVTDDKAKAEKRKVESYHLQSLEKMNESLREKSKMDWYENYIP